MNILNVPATLAEMGRGGRIDNVVAYGVLDAKVEGIPEWLSQVTVPSGLTFCLLRTFLLKLPSQEVIKCGLNSGEYFYVKGRILIALPENAWEKYRGKWVTVGGRSGWGFSLRHQKYGDWVSVYNIGGLVYEKTPNGWGIRENSISGDLQLPRKADGTPLGYVGFEFPRHESLKAFDGVDKALPYEEYAPYGAEEGEENLGRICAPEPRIEITDELVRWVSNEWEKIERKRAEYFQEEEEIEWNITSYEMEEAFNKCSAKFQEKFNSWFLRSEYTNSSGLEMYLDYLFGQNWSFASLAMKAHLSKNFPAKKLAEAYTLEGYYNSSERGTLVSLNSFQYPSPDSRQIPEPLQQLGFYEFPQVTPINVDESPLFVRVGAKYMSTVMYETELTVFDHLVGLSWESTGISKEEIEQSLEEFELQKGFQLTEEQTQGVLLAQNRAGVLSGCAGSGKTTTSDCITYILEKGGWDVLFATPTGKASKRLSEVVGREVKTLHSFFRIPVGLKPPMMLRERGESIAYGRSSFERPTALIFDEMAMCNTMLLSAAVIESLKSDNVALYFLGDVKQLPPIGSGMPFRDLMHLLPTVELGVSKRAAEGSLINYNCDKLNKGVGEFKTDDRFVFQESVDPKTDILSEVQRLRNEGVEEIQVISPYVSPKIPWSCHHLNPELQKILNPHGETLFTYGSNVFKKGDRVIHTRNNPELPLLNNNLEQIEAGIVNGEVGTLVEFLSATDPRVIHLKLEGWCALVEVDRGYYVYQGKLGRSGMFISDDWSEVTLAYAITVHKSQGSQYPCVVFPVSSKDNPRFVNRNMIYTAISRSQERVSLVGSAGALERLRKSYVDGSDCHSLLYKLRS